MSSPIVDMYDIVREECKMICENRFLKCSDCRVRWLCNNVHSPIPLQWKDLSHTEIVILERDN